MGMDDTFAVFILTHGRPYRVVTYDTLIRQGYTGRVYIVIDNEDVTGEDYKRCFADKVVVFDKSEVAEQYDAGDNFSDRRTVFYARNACFGIAKSLGVDYFLQLDDDYGAFYYRFTASFKFHSGLLVQSLDHLFAAILEYYKSIPALVIAMGQTGDYVGGQRGKVASQLGLKRKVMNTFFCCVDRPFAFLGRVNEDVNTYCVLGNRGQLLFTFFNTCIQQERTQHAQGGMTEMYQNEGTYRKSFYPVMYEPSFVRIVHMGYSHRRLHHSVGWGQAVPCILDEKWVRPSFVASD